MRSPLGSLEEGGGGGCTFRSLAASALALVPASAGRGGNMIDLNAHGGGGMEAARHIYRHSCCGADGAR